MPMMSPPPGMPQGAAPPGAAGGTGAATMPGPMHADSASGVAAVKSALELLQKSLGSIPLGSEIHASVLKAVTDISKHMGNLGQDAGPQDQMQQLIAAARSAQQGGESPLAGMMPGGAGGPPPPGAGAPPPMGAM